MSANWEEKFRQWAKPPTTTEAQRISNAENVVNNAIKASVKLKNRNVKVFAQGSYRNNTNVRQESDVDIAVVCYDVFFPQYPPNTGKETFGNRDGNYQYATFKNEVEQALVNYLGRNAVKREGNKAIDIRENTYRVEADVAPFFEHRRYALDKTFTSGVELRPDNNKSLRVINWPNQHYENGVKKNNQTGTRYKSMVRVFKSLKYEMETAGIQSAKSIPGFLLECLLWNVPDENFGDNQYIADVRKCIIQAYQNTLTDEVSKKLTEVSKLKNLFTPNQRWNRGQVNMFLVNAWNYIGFRNQ